MVKFKLFFAFLLLSYGICSSELRKNVDSPFRDFKNFNAPAFLTQISKDIQHSGKGRNGSEEYDKALKGLIHIFHQYNLNAPPHHTDGWLDYHDAEWPFMAMVYTALTCLNRIESHSSYADQFKKEVYFLISALEKPALTGFIEPHFGPLFSKSAKNYSCFVHGHLLFLYLRAKEVLKTKSFDHKIQILADGIREEYQRDRVLGSYKKCYYLPDNFVALGALALYDEIVHKDKNKEVLKEFIEDVKKYYCDKQSGLFGTYINPKEKTDSVGPRGIGLVYGLMFLPMIDLDFSKDQWGKLKKYHIRKVKDLAKTDFALKALLVTLDVQLGKETVILEHSYLKSKSYSEKNRMDGDSGPVIFGIGTSASGFGLASTKMNNDHKNYKGLNLMADQIGGRIEKDGKVYYINMFHEVGQAIILYGKTLKFSH